MSEAAKTSTCQTFKTSSAQLVPALYVVPTPIGNLRDMTLRGLDVLTHCNRIYAEDTRVTIKLLQAFGIHAPVSRYDEHTHAAVADKIIAAIQSGEIIALVSDAGTPAISDPGQYLVKACRDAGVAVIGLPGASSVTTALSAAGLRTDRFTFLGFLPAKTKARQSALHDFKNRSETVVLFESPHRIEALLNDIAQVMGDQRRIAIARELTKKFEEYLIGSVTDVQAKMVEHDHLKGEMVVLIEGLDGDAIEADEIDLDALLRIALQQGTVRDAAHSVALQTGLKKQDVYQRALALNKDES